MMELCDKCRVKAAHQVHNESGRELSFCQHHLDAYWPDLCAQGFKLLTAPQLVGA